MTKELGAVVLALAGLTACGNVTGALNGSPGHNHSHGHNHRHHSPTPPQAQAGQSSISYRTAYENFIKNSKLLYKGCDKSKGVDVCYMVIDYMRTGKPTHMILGTRTSTGAIPPILMICKYDAFIKQINKSRKTSTFNVMAACRVAPNPAFRHKPRYGHRHKR